MIKKMCEACPIDLNFCIIHWTKPRVHLTPTLYTSQEGKKHVIISHIWGRGGEISMLYGLWIDTEETTFSQIFEDRNTSFNHAMPIQRGQNMHKEGIEVLLNLQSLEMEHIRFWTKWEHCESQSIGVSGSKEEGKMEFVAHHIW